MDNTTPTCTSAPTSMRVLILASKRSMAQAILASLARTKPFPAGTDVVILCTIITGFYQFDYPSALTSDDFPYVGDPLFKPGNRMMSRFPHQWEEYVANAKPVPFEVITSNPGPEGLRTLLHNRDLVVDMGDIWHRDAVAFADAITLAGTSQPPKTRILSTSIYSMVDDSMDNITRLLAPGSVLSDDGVVRPWKPDNRFLLHGRGKDFMDWNWSLNARALLARPLRRAGVPSETNGVASVRLLSKYALHLILHLVRMSRDADADELTDSGVITMMSRWKGTGKYTPPRYSGFGSETSRAQILENLMALGLLQRRESVKHKRMNGLRVTGRAVMLAGLLPGTAYDPDFVFRSNAWCNDWPASRGAMSAYIRRYWGAIKRVDGMTGLSHVSLGPLEDARMMLAGGMDRETIAASAQIPPESVDAALQGDAISPGEARGLALASYRFRQSGKS